MTAQTTNSTPPTGTPETFTFTTQQLIAWAEDQEPWANEYWLKTEEAVRGYKMALAHLKAHAKYPIKEII